MILPKGNFRLREALVTFPGDTQHPSGRTGTDRGSCLLHPHYALPVHSLTGRDEHTSSVREQLPHARAFKVHVALKHTQ